MTSPATGAQPGRTTDKVNPPEPPRNSRRSDATLDLGSNPGFLLGYFPGFLPYGASSSTGRAADF